MCQQCGACYAKWAGQCANCGNWNSLDDLSLGDVIVFWGRAFFYKSRILEFASGAYAVSINGVPTY